MKSKYSDIPEKVIIELKALSEINDQHLAQALNYLQTHKLEIGLLVNFRAKSLQFKRLINQKKLTNKRLIFLIQ